MLHDPAASLPPSDDDPIHKKRRAALKRQNKRRELEARGIKRFVIEENMGRLADALQTNDEECLRDNEMEDHAAILRELKKLIRKFVDEYAPPLPDDQT